MLIMNKLGFFFTQWSSILLKELTYFNGCHVYYHYMYKYFYYISKWALSISKHYCPEKM